MVMTPKQLPQLLTAIRATINEHAEAVTALDQVIGDGDHVYNLQRGLEALIAQSEQLTQLPWAGALQAIGMTLMSTVGGASGSLYGTLFLKMAQSAAQQPLNLANFAHWLNDGVNAMKLRGKADSGEKTMLDVLIPVANTLLQAASNPVPAAQLYAELNQVAEHGVEATREMLATKGRASFLGERSRGHIDAGAQTAQLMLVAILSVVSEQSTTPA